jgi:endonuclease III
MENRIAIRHNLKPQKTKPKSQAEAFSVLKLIRQAVHSTTALHNISSQEPNSSSNPFKVLISTILSARTRDPTTEAAAARLFSRFPDAKSLSKGTNAEVSKLIKPVSFYTVKAARIIEVSRILVEKYGGSPPSNMEELLELPGVGRKTANCVLVYGFHTAAIPVDVHVHRISNRIGLVNTRAPEDTEVELSRLYERKYWLDVNELFVAFGQTVCKPVVPRCANCPVRPLCNYYRNVVMKG